MSLTILVVDDNDSLRAQVRQTLLSSELDVQLLEAADGAQALPVALSGGVDMVLSDIVMPNLDGIGLLRGIRQHRDAESLPVILITSLGEEETRNLSFEAGASDYLTRPFSALELVTRVQVQLRLKLLQRELQRTSERYRRLATVDDMTGLANRRHFLDAARRELARSRRHRLCMAVIVLDVDNLRRANDRAGYRAGDALITEVADCIRRQLRVADVLARLSGGTFAALLPHCAASEMAIVAERIREVIGAQAFPGLGAGEVTVSIGAAVYPGGERESVEEVMNAAQASLDRGKADGGNRLVFSPDAG